MQEPEPQSTAPAAASPAEETTPAAEGANDLASEVVAAENEASLMLDTLFYDSLPAQLQAPLDWLASFPPLLLAVVVSIGWAVGKLFQTVLSQIGLRLASRTHSSLDDHLLTIARRPAMTLPVVSSLFLVTAIVRMPPGLRAVTVSVLATIMLLSLLRAAQQAADVLLKILASRKTEAGLVQARTLPMFEMTSKIILVAMAGYLLLAIWGIDPTAWLASAGVIGIAVGFAARDTLANLFSGVFIVADAPYRLGDYIVLDSGERGEVTDVGLRSTRLLTRDDVEVTVPNAVIANAKIINESGGPWEKYRIRIPVSVSYQSDGEHVTEVLNDVARQHPDILDYPAPRVRCRRFSDSALDFEMLGWISKPVHRGRVTHELLLNIHKRFRAEGIVIPYPQRDVRMVPVAPESAPD
ncbi:MAG: mechanosensitive ion channel family protein, partial [Xanthomonadales bacterium]|nr:mechanosensitive ion channel family protein [Xanthomonadales bacterium]